MLRDIDEYYATASTFFDFVHDLIFLKKIFSSVLKIPLKIV